MNCCPVCGGGGEPEFYPVMAGALRKVLRDNRATSLRTDLFGLVFRNPKLKNDVVIWYGWKIWTGIGGIA